MKTRIFIALTVLLSLFSNSHSQTIVGDTAYGIWTKASSPYLINGETIVPKDSTLTLEPGVIVKFKTGTNFYPGNGLNAGYLHIKGTFIAIGTTSDTIVFTRNGDSGNWGIIRFDGANPLSVLKYCKVQYANKINYGTYSYYSGAITSGSIIKISNSLIDSNNSDGIHCFSEIIIENNIISNNQNAIYITNGHPKIINNKIQFNINGIHYYGASYPQRLINNIISYNKGIGVYIDLLNQPIELTNNTIAFNGTGIYKSNIYSKILDIKNTILYGNTNNFTAYDKNIQANYSIFEGERLLSGTIDLGNNFFINKNPFLDTITFTLPKKSIAKDNGTPDTSGLYIPSIDINNTPRILNSRIDIGAIESQEEYIRIDNPFANKAIQQGKSYTFAWNGTPSTYKLEYSIDNGATWNIINTSLALKNHNWNVPNTPSNSCKLKISSTSIAALFDTVSFRITEENIISNKEYIYGTWTKTNSPYIIEGEAIVPQGNTLNIEPGVVIKFKTGTNFDPYSNYNAGFLRIYGKLIAVGIQNDSIVFTRNSNSGNWGIILISESVDTSILKYCKIEFGNKYSNGDGVSNYNTGSISINSSKAFIHNTSIINNLSLGINNWKSTVNIDNCNISNNNTGISNYLGSGMVSNNNINNCKTGIYLKSFAPVYKNTIHNNEIGIYIREHGPVIENNKIFSNQYGIDGTMSGDYLNKGCLIKNNKIYNNNLGLNFNISGCPRIVNNLILKNSIGISLYNQYWAEINNNTLSKNGIGLLNNSPSTSLISNIIYFNLQSFSYSHGFTIKNSLIQDSILNPDIKNLGENLFSINPLFSDTLNNNFSLLINSPCINIGTFDTSGLSLPKVDIEGKQRVCNGRIDIGAYEYQETGEYIRLFYPYNHVYFVSNTFDSIKWLSSNTITNVDILYSTNNGKNWSIVASNIVNTGKYLWKTPELISDSSKLLIRKTGSNTVSDTSRYCFTISPNYIPDKKIIYGTWKKQYSPYKVFGTIAVPKDSTLNIEAGTSVLLNTGNSGNISVYGKINAIGDKANPIKFNRNGESGNWGNITLQTGARKSLFAYCTIENAYSSNYAAIAVLNDSVQISYCFINNNNARGIYSNFFKNDRSIINSIISNNKKDGVSGYFILNNSTIVKNENYGTVGNLQIKNSIIYSNKNGLNHGNYSISGKIEYSLIQDKSLPANMLNNGGNLFSVYPQFVDSAKNDFHLQPNSPCIDAGNPSDDYSQEPAPNGGRINMGAYGNTSEANSFVAIPRFDRVSDNSCSIFGGDTVTINGKYFLSTRGYGNIYIGDSLVKNYLVWNDTTIKFIVPSNHADTLDLKIKNNNSLENLLGKYFKYYKPIIKSIDPCFGKIEGGDTINIKGLNLSNGLQNISLLFDTVPATKIISWTDTLIKVITPAHAESLSNLVLFQSASINDTIKQGFLYTSKTVNSVCGNVSGTWSYPNIYMLTCPVTVPSGSKLTIEPGVKVYSKITTSGTLPKITVIGELSALGTLQNNILFSVLPEIPGSWDGIFANSTTNLNNCIIKNATNGITVGSSSVIIDSCQIQNNSKNGVYYNGNERTATGTLLNSILENNALYGIFCNASCYDVGGAASPVINNNIIRYNKTGGIRLNSTGNTPSSGSISKSAYASPSITGNFIYNNPGYAISGSAHGESAETYQGILMKRYAYITPEIKNNIICNNNGVINLYQGDKYSIATANILNNTLFENTSNIIVSNGEVNIINSIIRGSIDQNISVSGKLSVNYSNTMPIISGNGNISVDPQFINLAGLDFHLQATSPCINTGNPDTDGDGSNYLTDADDQDGDCTRKDIGALPYIFKPVKPTLYYPINNTTSISLNDTLRWRKALYAKQYRLQVSTTSDFSNIVLNKTINDTTQILSGLSYTIDYYWKVKAINIEDSSNWSDVWKFTTLTPYLNALPATLTIDYSLGSNATINVESNIEWAATDNQTWLTTLPANGSKNGTITVTAASANTSTTARTATITVSGTGVSSKTITLTQKPTPSLNVSTTNVTIASYANSVGTFSIYSNCNWTVTSDQNWITLSTNSGTGNVGVTLTAAVNPTTSTRIATVTVSGTDVPSKTITITQNGSAAALSVSPETLTIGAKSNSTNTFIITSTTSWNISINQTWLSPDFSSGTGNNTITLTAIANPTSSTRSATITVTGSGVSAKIVTVVQDAGTVNFSTITDDDELLYPNPAKDFIIIRKNIQIEYITISDVNGKNISDFSINENQIFIKNLPNGIYIIRITSNGKLINKKFIKQN